jgi:hypothetical protein
MGLVTCCVAQAAEAAGWGTMRRVSVIVAFTSLPSGHVRRAVTASAVLAARAWAYTDAGLPALMDTCSDRLIGASTDDQLVPKLLTLMAPLYVKACWTRI